MPGIHELIGADKVRVMDHCALSLFRQTADDKAMRAFAAGRNATAMIFSEREAPHDPLEAAQIVYEEVGNTPFASYAEEPEFKAASAFASCAINASRKALV